MLQEGRIFSGNFVSKLEQFLLSDKLWISSLAPPTAEIITNPHSKLKPQAEIRLQRGVFPIPFDY